MSPRRTTRPSPPRSRSTPAQHSARRSRGSSSSRPSGQTTTEFFVVAPGPPTVTGIEPGAGEPGATVPVTLRGLHFAGLTGVTTPPGDLTLANVTAVDDETVTLDVGIAPAAATGKAHTLTGATGGGSGRARLRAGSVGPACVGLGCPQ